jgi:GGDEF domain-containing protein
MGGDEFVVLVDNDADPDDLRLVAESSLDFVPTMLAGHEVLVCASVSSRAATATPVPPN